MFFEALNKLEKVALKHAQETGKPLVLVINDAHHFNHNENGKNLLLQLQQRAEAWAASGMSSTALGLCHLLARSTFRYPDDGIQHVSLPRSSRSILG